MWALKTITKSNRWYVSNAEFQGYDGPVGFQYTTDLSHAIKFDTYDDCMRWLLKAVWNIGKGQKPLNNILHPVEICRLVPPVEWQEA